MSHFADRKRVWYGPFFCLAGALAVAGLASCGRTGDERVEQGFAQPAATGKPLELTDPLRPCGAVVISVVSRVLDKPVSLQDSVRAVRCDPLGRATLGDVGRALKQLGFASLGANLSEADAHRLGLPLVMHVDDRHFVVGLPANEFALVLIDPPRNPVVATGEGLRSRWSGDCLIVSLDAESLAAKAAEAGIEIPEELEEQR